MLQLGVKERMILVKKEESNAKLNEILDFVKKHVDESGYPPSVREICRAVGFKSTSTVHSYLSKLDSRGFISKEPSKTRALKVITGKSDSRSRPAKSSAAGIDPDYRMKEIIDVPVIGRVTAGQPILAVENIDDTFPLPLDFVRDQEVFMLRIKGESMIDAGILDNDYVLVKKQETAVNGDIVVALIEDEATVKRFFRENGHIRLQPENRFYKPIILKDGVSVLGKVTGVFRKL